MNTIGFLNALSKLEQAGFNGTLSQLLELWESPCNYTVMYSLTETICGILFDY